MRIAYVSNNAMFFATHRLGLAEYGLAQGHEVALFTGQAGSPTVEPWAEEKIRAAGVPIHRMGYASGGTNPGVEAKGLWQLGAALRRFRPDIVHSASPKGNLYAGLAARFGGLGAAHVFAVSGMGYMFTAQAGASLRQTGLKRLYSALLRQALSRPAKRVIVQNRDDRRAMTALPFVAAHEVVLIPGSGTPIGPAPGAKDKLVLFPARMLYDKGAAEFAAAARRLKAAHPDWRFAMAGPWDYANPKAVPEAEILGWQAAGIETPGFVADMGPLYAAAAIVCLPSYREGFPKALMEAAAAGAAVVTTDAIGCRDAILPDMTGLQVPVADTDAVHDALDRLIADPALTARLGAAGRAHAEAQFDETAIVARIYGLYDEMVVAR